MDPVANIRRHRMTWSPGLALVTLLALIAGAGAETPPSLRDALTRFAREAEPQRRLDLAYEVLDKYAPVPLKSTVDPPDRETLSEVKRLLIVDLFVRNPHQALVTASGSTGNWLLRTGIRNDYADAEVPRLKFQGYYLEGLSDLDFAVMGAHALGFTGELYRTLATGRGASQLTREELQQLEISFMADEQITDVSPGGDPLKFWRQMLDLSRSSYHPEKYLTRGGKALYCIEHLHDRGAAAERAAAMPFSRWAQAVGQTIPPFTAQYLYGGCADMDYFLRHAFAKTGQEPMKTALQAIKYLQRQAWMMHCAADNAARMPGGIGVSPEDVARFTEAADLLEGLCQYAVDARMWEGDAMVDFRMMAEDESSQVCLGGHKYHCSLGWELVWKLERDGLDQAQALVLDEIEYDLRTVHEQRYRDGKPRWYDTVVATDTLGLLEAIATARPKLNLLLAQAGGLQARDPELGEVEIGPLAPPPVLRLELRDMAMTPVSARPGDAATFTAACVLHGLLPEGAGAAPPLTPAQLSDMQQLSYWAWQATRTRAQLRHLMLVDRKNRTVAPEGERQYVSPYEVSELAESLKECEESVSSWSERLGAASSSVATGRYQPNLKPAATLSAPEDYLTALKDTCSQTVEALETLEALGSELSTELARIPRDTGSGAINLDLCTRMAEQKQLLDRVLHDAAPHLKRTRDMLSEAGKYTGWAQDVRQAMTGDIGVITGRTGELEEYLFGLAEEAEDNAKRAAKIQNAIADSIGLFRRCARTIPESDQFRLRGRMVELIRHWDKRKNKLMLSTTPALEERAQWLNRGAWAAKSVKAALKTLTLIQRYRDLRRQLEGNLRMAGETKRAVVALTACGDIIQAGAEYLPIPVLRQVITDYAGLLSAAGSWSTGFTAMLEQQRQEHGFDVLPAPRAIRALIQEAGRPDPSLFNVDHGDFATLNRLTVIAYSERPAEETGEAWLIWAPDQDDGYLKLGDREGSKVTFREASLLAARYQRLYRRPVTAEELKDLLTTGKTVRGLLMRETIAQKDLHSRGAWVLRNEAMQEYIASVLARQELSPDELARYRGMMERAAALLGEGGFLVDDEDIKAIIAPAKLQPTVTGWWDTLLPSINLAAKAWDYLTDGEQQRVDAATRQRIAAKEQARAQARERLWEEARNATPGCGLTLADVSLKADHALVWERGLLTHTQTTQPGGEEVTLRWQATIPQEVRGERAYLCKVSAAGHDSISDEAELPLQAGGEWVLIRTANRTLRLGRLPDLTRTWANDEVLDAGLDGKPIKVGQFPGTGTYSTREEALDAIVARADDGGPMGVKRIFQVWRPTTNPKRVIAATIDGQDYLIHTIADTVTLVTETSGVQTGRVWYFPAEEEKWLRDRGVVPYIRLSPLYLLHQTGHGTSDGYVKTDHWSLFGSPPNEHGKISVPDPYWLGSVFITDVDTCIGPLTDSYSVAAALGAVATRAGQTPPSVEIPGTGLAIGPDDLPTPSASHPPTEALAEVAKALVKSGPVRLAGQKGEMKFQSFPPGYINELLYENNDYGPEDYQARILAYFRGLRTSDAPARQRLLEPLEVEPVISDAGAQPAVVLYPKGGDWKASGRVFDGWLVQGGSSTPAAQWLADHGTANPGQALRPDPPLRVAVLGPIMPSFLAGGRRFGWSATGGPIADAGVRLSRAEVAQRRAHYAALSAPATMSLQASAAGTFQVLVRKGEGRLLDFGEVRCAAGQEFRLDLTVGGAGELRGPGVAVAGKPYDLQDAMRNEVVLLTQSGKFAVGHQGKHGTQEYQVTVQKPGVLKVVVQTPGPFEHGQSGTASRCDRIERMDGTTRTAVALTKSGGDWKLNPVIATSAARLEQPGTYAVHITQALTISPTWGDILYAPPHDYTVTVSVENLQ